MNREFVCMLGGVSLSAIILGMCWKVDLAREATAQRAEERKLWMDAAVTHGAAEYYLDENWEKQFRWKTNAVEDGK